MDPDFNQNQPQQPNNQPNPQQPQQPAQPQQSQQHCAPSSLQVSIFANKVVSRSNIKRYLKYVESGKIFSQGNVDNFLGQFNSSLERVGVLGNNVEVYNVAGFLVARVEGGYKVIGTQEILSQSAQGLMKWDSERAMATFLMIYYLTNPELSPKVFQKKGTIAAFGKYLGYFFGVIIIFVLGLLLVSAVNPIIGGVLIITAPVLAGLVIVPRFFSQDMKFFKSNDREIAVKILGSPRVPGIPESLYAALENHYGIIDQLQVRKSVPNALPAQSVTSQQLAQPQVPPQQNVNTQPYSGTPSSKINFKIIGILAGAILTLVLLGIGGWYGYQHFNTQDNVVGAGDSKEDSNLGEDVAETETDQEADVSKIVISDTDYYVDNAANLILYGFITNNTGENIGSPWISVKSFDDKGDVLYEGHTMGPVVMGKGEKVPFRVSLPTNTAFEQLKEDYTKDERIPITFEAKVTHVEYSEEGLIEAGLNESTVYNNKIKVVKAEKISDYASNKINKLTLELLDGFDKLKLSQGYGAAYDSKGNLVAVGLSSVLYSKPDDYRIYFHQKEGYEKAVRFDYYFYQK